MSFELQDHELAGFDLGGWRLPNGTIQISSTRRIINDWPEEITLKGDTFTLEDVSKGSINEVGAQWENAIYV